MKHQLFPIAELPPGSYKSASLGQVDIVVIRRPDGALHALRDRCPHRGARLSADGRPQPLVVGSVAGEYAWAPERMVVRCSWHGLEFDLESGRCVADAEHSRVRTYPVSVEDGMVVVER